MKEFYSASNNWESCLARKSMKIANCFILVVKLYFAYKLKSTTKSISVVTGNLETTRSPAKGKFVKDFVCFGVLVVLCHLFDTYLSIAGVVNIQYFFSFVISFGYRGVSVILLHLINLFKKKTISSLCYAL